MYKLINYRSRTNFRYIDWGVFLAAKIKQVATNLIGLVKQGGGSAVFDEAAEIGHDQRRPHGFHLYCSLHAHSRWWTDVACQ